MSRDFASVCMWRTPTPLHRLTPSKSRFGDNSRLRRVSVDLTSKMESTPEIGSYRHFFGILFGSEWGDTGVHHDMYIHIPTWWGGRFTKEREMYIYTLEKNSWKILLYDVIFGVESIFDVKSSVSRRNHELSPKTEYRRWQSGREELINDSLENKCTGLRVSAQKVFNHVPSPKKCTIN